ncbi:ABC transporter ATP-binding protein [Paracoccus denitrificans]|jgi:peptide/nickel transport system ATP-binding protein|uniref:ABC transporter related protein n=1 Tax=Paracoccus denitrificans (strain Pd 1222) TaxID=318586 RepID=A1B068_PARDP|nr:ABC transporter ATP-binding protein [Paracoccus denitrificans]ABL68912.1 ABC transporter related protein [Paracoccus denitrificans PD1222]MBB4625361.1 peptide/nickel transport system ATP-binding protein [Paracoccus denitrificans]MCU7428187.1 ABC transporter ATP-binding protein [Paracoccus denitrificans]QAR26958.1 ABC transporter ATP-binding protein [Paracoccus denitrificans]UPV95916.1 ABC transporter ATP-binding protein [Paracoccus denitrificans]
MIQTSRLSVEIGPHEILRGIDLALPPGQITGLVGESGSGKSMAALAIMGLLPDGMRTEGRVDLDGRNLLELSERDLCRIRGKRIGMIFQEPMTALNPLMTIGDQVAEVLRIHQGLDRKAAQERARDRLDRVGLTAPRFPLTLYPHELSGGQRQRVAIALAIALRPDLLIADEPTTALDVTTQAKILDLLKALVRDEGMALLLITHDLAVVAGIADRVAVMQHGTIVEEGPTEQVFRQQRHPYTRALFAASTHQPRLVLPRAEPRPLLQVEGAVREYPLPRRSLGEARGSLRAVDGVGFRIEAGESVGLVGESGCGKSTLTRAILGLDPLQGGRILLDGQEIRAGRAMPAGLRAKMQVVFQDPFGSFDPRWRVERLVAEPFHLTGLPRDWREQVAEALYEVGIAGDAMRRHIHEFSGGQRQRIAIARALIIKPRLIVLDEAVSALDVRVRAQVLDLLAGLRVSHGLAYLFISHDLSVVRQITDRVMIMEKGRIVETGPTHKVMDAPEHPYTQSLLAATPRIPVDWHVHEQVSRVALSTPAP